MRVTMIRSPARWSSFALMLLLAGCESGSPPASTTQDAAGGDATGDATEMDAATMDVSSMDVVSADVTAPDVVSTDVVDAPGDTGPQGCTRDDDCASMSGTPACDTATGRCVRCTPASDRCPAGEYCVTMEDGRRLLRVYAPSDTAERASIHSTSCIEVLSLSWNQPSMPGMRLRRK